MSAGKTPISPVRWSRGVHRLSLLRPPWRVSRITVRYVSYMFEVGRDPGAERRRCPAGIQLGTRDRGAASRVRGAAESGRYPNRTVACGGVNWFRTLSGVPADGSPMGVKVIAGAFARRQVSYLISLFDQDTAELVALMDGNSITGYRTAATSALAADLLARAGALTVAVIGSGFEARKHVRALAAVRPLRKCGSSARAPGAAPGSRRNSRISGSPSSPASRPPRPWPALISSYARQVA